MLKLRSLAELGATAEMLRGRGQSVVLAHGTFDLLHLGHVKHLQAAAKEGDVLIVTVTADRFVNKGPGRPIFSEHMRAEMLSSLECVNYVGISDAPSSEAVLQAIRPNVYVKGSDYINSDDDVTGKIVAERKMVEKHGGRIAFTQDITFSSTSLINRHVDVFDPALREYLETQRSNGLLNAATEAVAKVKDLRVLLIGDTIIDEYQYVAPLGKSPKENMIATRFEDREMFAGGVIAAANHVAAFCKEVEVLTAIGGKHDCEDLIRASLKPNVKLWLARREGCPTTRKCRFVESGYLRKLFEVYVMDDAPLAGENESALVDMIRQKAAQADLVIVTDFGHGLVTPPVVQALATEARFLAINTQTNSANIGFNLVTKYPRADYICIDGPEARLAVADKHSDLGLVAGKLLPAKIACDNLIVTAGRQGCVTYNRLDGISRIPAFTKTVVDTVGAGDAFFVVSAPLVAAGAKVDVAGFVGNVAGAIKVGIVGHRTSLDKGTLLKYVQTLLK
jgi:rfaE bifunctional protein nucleotidyltransferase chain/domain